MESIEMRAFYSIEDKRFILPDLGRAFGNVPPMENFLEHPPIKRFIDTLHYNYKFNVEYVKVY